MIDDKSVLGKIRVSFRAFENTYNLYVLRKEYTPPYYPEDRSDIDRIVVAMEFEEFKNAYPETHKKYLADILNEYKLLQSDTDAVLGKFEDRRSSWPATKLCRDLEYLIDFLKEMLIADNESHESFPESEKFTPTEKLLIWYYLHPKSFIPGYQYQLKPGIYLLSNLLEIKPESLKKPLLKLDEYTIKKNLTESQARGLCPPLEKVRSFFDESALPEISKKVEERISELGKISGKI